MRSNIYTACTRVPHVYRLSHIFSCCWQIESALLILIFSCMKYHCPSGVTNGSRPSWRDCTFLCTSVPLQQSLDGTVRRVHHSLLRGFLERSLCESAGSVS